MKILLILFVFLLPFHALIITFLKCKLGVNGMDFIRFWKEGIIILLLILSGFFALKNHNYSLKRLYKNNYILGLSTAFIISSLLYIYLPFFEFKLSAFLGFKYDTFFLFALIIGLFLPQVKENFYTLIKTIFVSTGIILIVFLPWYVFGDISQISSIIGYSDKVSTYEANQCISFAQNVNGEHRFQASFGGPIRFSVFLVVFYMMFIGYSLTFIKDKKIKNILIIIGSILVFAGIFFSYSKTSILGLIFSIVLFIYLTRKIVFEKILSKNFLISTALLITLPLVAIISFKRDLFLHLGSLINRADNLGKSVEMFFYNPFGYGLGIAGPASQIGNSIESAGSWQIATVTVTKTHKFLPENWFVQILLEQGIIGFFIFISLLSLIAITLYKKCRREKTYLSISIFVSFVTLLFMSNFTHGFEESATSYILFLIIGGYLSTKIKH